MIYPIFQYILQQFAYLKKKQTINYIIKSNQSFYPVHGPNLAFSNHISMTAIALYRMNQNPDLLQQFYQQEKELEIFIKKGDKQITITELNITNYKNNTGQEYFSEILEFNKKLIKTKGLQYALNFLLNNFGYQWANHLFHTVIRLQFALDLNNYDEIAFSMAYKTVKSYDIPQYYQQKQKDTINFEDQVKFFQEKIGSQLSLGLKYQDYYEKQLFQENYKNIQFYGTDQEFKQISKSLLLLYLKSFFLYKDDKMTNFISLHLITGFYAFRNVYQYYQKNVKEADLQKMADGYFLGFFANYCNLRCPSLSLTFDVFNNIKSDSEQMEIIYTEFKNIDQNTIPNWDQLKQQASQSLESHTIKIVYVCQQEAQYQPELDFLYRLASYYRINNFQIE